MLLASDHLGWTSAASHCRPNIHHRFSPLLLTVTHSHLHTFLHNSCFLPHRCGVVIKGRLSWSWLVNFNQEGFMDESCLFVWLFLFFSLEGLRDSTVTSLSWIIRCSFQVLLELFFIFSNTIFSSSKQKLKQGDHCNLITTNPFVNFLLCLFTCRDLPASALLFWCILLISVGLLQSPPPSYVIGAFPFIFSARLCADEAAVGFI